MRSRLVVTMRGAVIFCQASGAVLMCVVTCAVSSGKDGI